MRVLEFHVHQFMYNVLDANARMCIYIGMQPLLPLILFSHETLNELFRDVRYLQRFQDFTFFHARNIRYKYKCGIQIISVVFIINV